MTFKMYNVLGLDRKDNPGMNDIKRAYKRKAFEFHPDKNKGNVSAEEKFKEISNAYEVLSDESKKRIYDQTGDDGYKDRMEQGNNGMDGHDIFEQFFRGRGNPFGGFEFRQHQHQEMNRKCETITKGLSITLEEVFQGISKNLCISITKYCHECTKKCNNCNGSGFVKQVKNLGVFQQIFTGSCDKCDGSGQLIEGKASCNSCNGKGKYVKEVNAYLNLPKGIASGYRTTFPEMGEQPKTPDQKPGDLILDIKVNDHAIFKRSGNDLYYKCELTYIESVIGKNIVIPYIGNSLEINTNMFGVVYPGKNYMIQGKGAPILNTDRFGNLFVEFNIIYPKIVNKEKLNDLEVLLKETFQL